MVSIKWCLKARNGIQFVQPNKNMSDSYLKMAEESLNVINKVKNYSKIWLATTCYYTLYYCLYSVMIRMGVKCEIHSCSIELMKRFLFALYDKAEIELIEDAFEIRQDVQYYPDRLLNVERLNSIANDVSDFIIKTKEIILKLNEKEIQSIRHKVEGK